MVWDPQVIPPQNKNFKYLVITLTIKAIIYIILREYPLPEKTGDERRSRKVGKTDVYAQQQISGILEDATWCIVNRVSWNRQKPT